MTNDDTSPSMRALCQAASAQAAGWSSGARLQGTSRAAAGALRRKRLLALGLLGGSSLLALAWVAEPWVHEPASPAAALSASVAATPPAALPAPAPRDDGTLAERVRWQGDELMVDFDEVPLPEAAASLARATGTTLGDAGLLRQSVTVTLHLRVRSAGEAWRHVLQGRARFSIACPTTGCQVRIAGEDVTPAVAATPAAGWAHPVPDATPAKAPTEEERSQPDGSC